LSDTPSVSDKVIRLQKASHSSGNGSNETDDDSELSFNATKFESKIAFEDVYGDGVVPPNYYTENDTDVFNSKPGKLDYVPLVLIKDPKKDPLDPHEEETAHFMEHVGNPNLNDPEKGAFKHLDLNSSIE
jgi:hypothetical protein